MLWNGNRRTHSDIGYIRVQNEVFKMILDQVERLYQEGDQGNHGQGGHGRKEKVNANTKSNWRKKHQPVKTSWFGFHEENFCEYNGFLLNSEENQYNVYYLH